MDMKLNRFICPVLLQHAVTFAAGLACEGIIPFVAIYSSFLQRGYDQVGHLGSQESFQPEVI